MSDARLELLLAVHLGPRPNLVAVWSMKNYASLPIHVRLGLFAHWLYGYVPGGEYVRELIRAIEPGVREFWREYEG